MALTSRRGSGLLVALLALLALIAASVAAMVAVVVAHAQRVSHQRDGLQALYLAETGVEEALARAAEGRGPPRVRRTVYRTPEPGEVLVPSPDAPRGRQLAGGSEARLTVGSYEATVGQRGDRLTVRSVGVVLAPSGRPVRREVRVACRREGRGWAVESWEQVP